MVGVVCLVFSFPVCHGNEAFPDNPGFTELCGSASSG